MNDFTFCPNCEQEYELHEEKDAIFVFLDAMWATHIDTTCEHCGNQRNIFFMPIFVLQLQNANPELSVFIFVTPTEDVVLEAVAYWGNNPPANLPYPTNIPILEPPEQFPVPFPNAEAPHWMLRELYDQMREFEKGTD